MMWSRSGPRDKIAHLWRDKDVTLCGKRVDFATHYPAGKADRCEGCLRTLNAPIAGYRPPVSTKRRAAR